MFFKTLFLVAALSAFSFAQERYVKPVDEAGKDPSFVVFREKLIAAVKRKDVKYLLSIVDKNIQNGFGGDNGIEEFKKWWNINDPRTEFWKEFLPAVTKGGSFGKEGTRERIFYAPYIKEAFPADLEARDYRVITGRSIALRREGKPGSPVVAWLSYNIVKVDEDNSIEGRGKDGVFDWYAVETLGGKKGFVKAEFVRSPLDNGAVFMKVRGKWKLTAFAAGD
jgi:hypothetical protein